MSITRLSTFIGWSPLRPALLPCRETHPQGPAAFAPTGPGTVVDLREREADPAARRGAEVGRSR